MFFFGGWAGETGYSGFSGFSGYSGVAGDSGVSGESGVVICSVVGLKQGSGECSVCEPSIPNILPR